MSAYKRSSSGHVRVYVGRAHPLADTGGWAFLHRLVWAAAGNELREGWDVHHRNGDRADNRIANLVAEPHAEHSRTHATSRQRDERGRWVA